MLGQKFLVTSSILCLDKNFLTLTFITYLAGLVDITRQLKHLLPILVACFHDFMPSVSSTAQLDPQSCDCMQFILQSVDIIVRFLVSGVCGSESEPKIVPFCGKPGLIAYNQLLSPMILKKLWDVYPLNLVNLTRKVY